MANKKLIVPSVHSNGTGKKALLEQLEKAYTAIGDAQDALRETAPNGRDYYVYEGNPYERAREEWRQRMLKLESVRAEIDAIVGGIENLEMEVEVSDD